MADKEIRWSVRHSSKFGEKHMRKWFPSGKLSDGTLLFGPLRDKPTDEEPVIPVVIDGKTWWVKHSGKMLSSDQQAEVTRWMEKKIAPRKAKSS